MTEAHLQNLVEKRQEILNTMNELQTQFNSTREGLLKVQGAIEYLEAIGVKLPEPTAPEEVAEEAPEGSEEDSYSEEG